MIAAHTIDSRYLHVEPRDTSPSNRADAAAEPSRPVIRGTRHACVAGHYLAAHAGFAILEAGGNAIDAGVAAGITEGVVQSEQVNIAGVAPILIYLAESGQVVSIAGVGPWPQAADCELLETAYGGHVPPGLLRSVVPGAPAAWVLALRRYGTMSFGEVVAAAIRLARDGFPIHAYNAEQIARNADDYGRWEENARIYLPGGVPPEAGNLFVQADLAQTLQYLVDEECANRSRGRDEGLQAVHDAFYRGDIARAIVAYHREHNGWLLEEDLATYQPEIAPATRGSFRGLEVCTCGFWSQGPVLIQMLNLLEGTDLGALDHNSARYLHLLVEVVKLAFADRHQYYADPAFVDVPGEALLSKRYAALRRRLIQTDRAWAGMPPPGDPRAPAAMLSGDKFSLDLLDAGVDPGPTLDTTFCAAVDARGNVFCVSPSDTSSDTPIIPGTGLCPSARGAQGWGERSNVNCVAPGKRPRITPNPVMLLERGRPRIALGTPGGDVQPQAMLQALLNMLAFNMQAQHAVEAPRFTSWSFPNSREPHAYHPGLLALEGCFPRVIGDRLGALGHRIAWWPDRTGRAGAVCAISFDARRGFFEAAADYRRAGYALGW